MGEGIWVVGDVHGAIFTLERLLAKIPKEARIIFVGDLVDRGNYSKEVFELVTSCYETLLGNHEFLMYNYIRDAILRGKDSMWNLNPVYGGAQTVASYRDDVDTLLRHVAWIPKLPKYKVIRDYFITHGFGLPYYRQRDGKGHLLYVNRLERIRDDWEEGWSAYPIINIFGHTAYSKPKFGPNYIGIDTGCGHRHVLSAIELGSHKIISVQVDGRDFS
ncbi:MAG: hypothetical protein C6I00_04530 [Nitratiruptor sp.]|nr:hypothetical protein [Nitratiruptor sp.]NPA84356.1 hypothetical protein [Campylobacterota bacterium]